MTLSKRLRINKDLSVVVRHMAPNEALKHQAMIYSFDELGDIRDFCRSDKFDEIFGERLTSGDILYLLTPSARVEVLKLSQSGGI